MSVVEVKATPTQVPADNSNHQRVTLAGGGTVYYSKHPTVSVGSNEGSLTTVGEGLTLIATTYFIAAIEGPNISVEPVASSSSSGGTSSEFLPSLGTSVDIGPSLQAAFDSHPYVTFERGEVYYLNSAIFLDSTAARHPYVLDATGAEIIYGSGLPSASTMSGLAGTKWAFFNNTKRSALSGGVVTTSEANRASESTLPAAPRFTIIGGTHEANGNIIGIAYGNGAATHTQRIILRNIQAGISWSGYVDENKASDTQIQGANPTGGTATRIIYQRDSGDGTAAENTKAFGGVHMDLSGCHGFKADASVSGQFTLNNCEGVISAAHQETDEIGNLPFSVSLNRTRLTYEGGYSFDPKKSTHATFKIEDEEGPTASFLNLIEHTAVYNYREADGSDPERGPTVRIVALNKNGRIRARGFRAAIFNNVSGTGGKQAAGLYIDATEEAIQTALTEAADTLATGDWELLYTDGAWKVRLPNGAAAPSRSYSAPTLAAAEETTGIAGALSHSTTYQYVAAVKHSPEHYTLLSAAPTTKAGTAGSVKLTLTNTSTPSVMAVWRSTGEKVKAEPDHYIELPMDGYEGSWFDTGTHINGRTWKTTSLPIPNTVAGT